MGIGCWLRTTVHYRGQSFRTKDEVQDKIDENNRIIEVCEKDLMMYMTMTEPAKFWRESEAEVGETPLTWMYNEVQRCIDGIKESTEENARLYILLNEWDPFTASYRRKDLPSVRQCFRWLEQASIQI